MAESEGERAFSGTGVLAGWGCRGRREWRHLHDYSEGYIKTGRGGRASDGSCLSPLRGLGICGAVSTGGGLPLPVFCRPLRGLLWRPYPSMNDKTIVY